MTSAAPQMLAEDVVHILERTGDLWEEIRGLRLFVTGGTGFYGCWLLESFTAASDALKLGAQMTVLSRDPAAFRAKSPHLANHGAVELVQGDVTSFAFPDGKFHVVIHAAIEYGPPHGLLAKAIQGTQRTLEFAVAAGATRYLYASSGAVYGRQPLDVSHVSENYAGAPNPTDPHSAYGEAKRCSELLCAAFHEAFGLCTTIARGFAFVGPYLRLGRAAAMGSFLGDALCGRPVLVNGDGTPFRSYLYGADLAIWLWTILHRGTPCRPYNVGSDAALSIRDLAGLVAEAVRPGAEIRVLSAPSPGVPPERYVPCIDRARRELALEPWIDLREGVRRTALWHRRFHE